LQAIISLKITTMKKLVSLVIIITCITTAQGQYVADAIRYSQNFPTLTARSMAMGGAFTSLGSDFSSACINPAGLGLYRKSEFLFSPGLVYSKTTADYLGQKNDNYKYQFILGSLGYVGTYNSNKKNGLVSASYAIGYNRLNNFNNTTYIRGENLNNSLVDYFMQGIDGTDPESLDPFTSRLAFDAYVIDTVPGSDFAYETPVFYPINQRKTVTTKGGTGEWSFSFGLNFNNILYLGMGLGIQQLRYEQTAVHSEFDDRNLTDFSNFHYTEYLNVEGTGLNMNMGMMVRMLKIMRIGASVHLPTYYRIDEAYKNSMYSEFDNGFIPTEVNGDIYAEGTFKYKLNTPLKLQGGASIQLGKAGIIAADVEYIDYSGMRLGERDKYTDFSEQNQTIKDVYRPVLNLKLGGELRLDNLSIRLGGGYYPSPYASGELNKSASYSELTTGLGYRDDNFFFDLGFSALLHQEYYVLYFDNTSKLNQQKYRFIASMGFRF
jgi:hypothetical protein